MGVLSRRKFDLDAEQSLAWAALSNPEMLHGLKVQPTHFYDPLLGKLYERGLALYRLGSAHPVNRFYDLFPKGHPVWSDPDFSLTELLQQMPEYYGEHGPHELAEAAQVVIKLSEARK